MWQGQTILAGGLIVALVACSSDSDVPPPKTSKGGSTSSGGKGSSPTGGAVATAGSTSTPPAGGNASGGLATSLGGTGTSGGTPSGGTPSGGAPSAGTTASAGGKSSVGGSATGGGATQGGRGTGGSPTSGTSSTGTGGAPAGSLGSPCSATVACSAGLACSSATNTCVTAGPCTTSADCPAGLYCDLGTCTTSTTASPCATDANCPAGQLCLNGQCGCNSLVTTGENVPPNVLVVLDRSQSMLEDLPSGGTKWAAAQTAAANLLASQGANIQFGLALYPGTNLQGTQGGQCNAGYVPVAPGPGTAATINTTFSSAGNTSFNTPIATMLNSLLGLPGLQDPTRDNYIVFITDGMENCLTAQDGVAAVTALLNQTIPVKTYVIGFSGDPSVIDANGLAAMAAAGGTNASWFSADSLASLDAAFAAIARQVFSCTFNVPAPPAGSIVDPRKIIVTFTPSTGIAQVLPRATTSACTDGQWYALTVDANQVPTEIQLCPDICTTAQNDTAPKVQVTFDCIVQL
jgi:Cys-rich repeat protein